MFAQRYIPRSITEIAKSDSKVALVGKVVEGGEGSFILDDGTAKAEIKADQAVKEGQQLRVFCLLEDERLIAEIIQDMGGLDMKLFKSVKELYNKAGV